MSQRATNAGQYWRRGGKPHIERGRFYHALEKWVWLCFGDGSIGTGETVVQAYTAWRVNRGKNSVSAWLNIARYRLAA